MDNGKQQEWEVVILIFFIDESDLMAAALPKGSLRYALRGPGVA